MMHGRPKSQTGRGEDGEERRGGRATETETETETDGEKRTNKKKNGGMARTTTPACPDYAASPQPQRSGTVRPSQSPQVSALTCEAASGSTKNTRV